MIHQADTFGWQEKLGKFVLPRFTISTRGDIEPNPYVVVDELAPCRRFDPPTPLDQVRAFTLTRPGLPQELFWATMACIGANIVARAFNQAPKGIGLVGRGAVLSAGQQPFWRAAANSIARDNNILARPEVFARASRHNWPLIIGTTKFKTRAVLGQWLSSNDEFNCVIDFAPRMPSCSRSVAVGIL